MKLDMGNRKKNNFRRHGKGYTDRGVKRLYDIEVQENKSLTTYE